MPETASEGDQPRRYPPSQAELAAKGFTEPRFSIDPKNGANWLLHVRADTIEEFVAQINDVWDPHKGDRSDMTNLILFSFNPGMIDKMAAGQTAEEALGYEPDDLTTAAYNALAQGARRQPVSAAASNGGGRGGGGGGQKTFVAAEIGDRLPDWFADQLDRKYRCPSCHDPAGVFNDNREEAGNLPTFKCANRECKGSKNGKYAWGAYEPDSSPRGSSSRTR